MRTRELLYLDGVGPAYSQVRQAIARPILSGEMPPGTRIPSEVELVELFSVSRMTVNRALRSLAEEGLIARRRRHGTFVAKRSGEHAVLEISNMEAEIARDGAAYRYEILSRKVVRATRDQSTELSIEKDQELLQFRCLHYADDAPVLYEDRLINLAVAPNARLEKFEAAPPSRWLLDRMPWFDAEHVIAAINADADIARLLKVRKGAACLRVVRRTWQGDRPVTWVTLTYPGERQRLVGRFSSGDRLPKK